MNLYCFPCIVYFEGFFSIEFTFEFLLHSFTQRLTKFRDQDVSIYRNISKSSEPVTTFSSYCDKSQCKADKIVKYI